MAEPKVYPAEYSEAFGSVRAAKNLFWLVVGLAILYQLAAFVAVDFFGLIDPSPTGVEMTAAPVGEPAATQASRQDAAEWWTTVLRWTLPATKFIALVAALLLSFSILLGLKLSLIGRLGGVPGFVSSFFWSLVLFAILVPWRQILQSSLASGALFNLGELIEAMETVKTSWGAEPPSRFQQAVYYTRFGAYPIAALLVWLVVQAKFGRGLKRIMARLAPPEEAE